jgi:5'-phosphate synthase pdxT subunit
VHIGVLALQGSFREHMSLLNRIDNVIVSEVRTEGQLKAVDGLVIPGGESTTMALVAEKWGLLPALREFQGVRLRGGSSRHRRWARAS